MSISVSPVQEARRAQSADDRAVALGAPLFADLAGDAAVSFEFFPPKSDAMEATMWEAVKTLAPDVSAPWTIEAYLAGRDPALEAAVAVLK